jgi:predicted nucleotide-binding protein (sugar kinase/HSP70/actin superfamily)
MLKQAGAEVIVSPNSNEALLKEGLRHCFSDFCLPVKAYLGHVASLRDSVDYIFVPRYVSVEQDAFMCPKFLGLPDVVRASFTRLPELISPQYHLKDGGEERAAKLFTKGLAKGLGIGRRQAAEAFQAYTAQPDDVYESAPVQDGINIAVLGRPYLVFDDQLSSRVIRTLQSFGVHVVYGPSSDEEIEQTMGSLIKRVYWSMGKDIVAEAERAFCDPRVTGVVHMVNATCGPDSFATEVIKPIQKRYGKPYMVVTVDEHTSDVGIQTRLEAFIDMMQAAPAIRKSP